MVPAYVNGDDIAGTAPAGMTSDKDQPPEFISMGCPSALGAFNAKLPVRLFAGVGPYFQGLLQGFNRTIVKGLGPSDNFGIFGRLVLRGQLG